MVHVPESSQSDYSILRINIKSGNNFEKNNKRTKKPFNRFLQDGASTGIRSLHIPVVIKFC